MNKDICKTNQMIIGGVLLALAAFVTYKMFNSG